MSVNPFHPLADKLLGCWLINQRAGDVVLDWGPYRRHGTRFNMEGSDWKIGPHGYAADFTATNEYIECGYFPELEGTAHATLSAWYYRVATNDTVVCGREGQTSGSANRFNFIWWTDGKVYMAAENASSSYPSFTLAGTGWRHITMAYDGSEATAANRMKAYVDGASVSITGGGDPTPATLGSPGASSTVQIGRNVLGGRSTDGMIRQVMLWNRTLTALEAMEVYKGAPGLFSIEYEDGMAEQAVAATGQPAWKRGRGVPGMNTGRGFSAGRGW